MLERRSLIIVGAGGFGQEAIWVAMNMNRVRPTFDIIGYCDDTAALQGKSIYGCSVLGTLDEMIARLNPQPLFLCAIGKNAAREKVTAKAIAAGWEATTLIDPSVIIANHVTVGTGTYIGAGSILSPYAKVGSHVIINHCCSIGHDSILEDFCQVSPGGRISGAVVLKRGSFVASNAVVAPRVKVGSYSLLGACSFAASDIPDHVTAIGNPARVLMPSHHSA